MTDTECSEGWVVGNERGGHEKVALKILDVVQRRLLLVPVRLPSSTLEWEQRLTKTFQVRYLLVCGCCECCLYVFVYITMSISSGNFNEIATQRERRTRSSVHIELRSPPIPHMQPDIWTDTEVLAVERHRDACLAPCYLFQVVDVVKASTSREGDRHDEGFELNKLTQYGGEIRFLQLHPQISELRTLHKFHEDVLSLRSVVRRRRVAVHLRNGQVMGTEESHRGNLTCNGVELGFRSGVRDASDYLEPVVHGNEEDAVEASLIELLHGVDVLKRPADRLCRKSTELAVVELMLALCETKIVVDAENCAALETCNVGQESNMYTRLTAMILKCS